jgi:hypothetical protein
MESDSPPTAEQPKPKLRWFRLTPDRIVVALLVAEGFLDILPEKSRRDGRKWGVRVQPSRRDGNGIWYATLPSDESLGYRQTTLRVEIIAVSEHRSRTMWVTTGYPAPAAADRSGSSSRHLYAVVRYGLRGGHGCAYDLLARPGGLNENNGPRFRGGHRWLRMQALAC